MANVIQFSSVSKHFGETEAVRDISFHVTPGEIVGFVGPNGAGKTTTISMLLGFIHPTHGTIKLFGNHVTRPENAHKTHRRIGYVAGDMALFDNLTGKQYLNFMAHRTGCEPEVRARLDKRLSPQLNKKLKNLSRGNKQKIALIAALQHDPELLIMDEPTSGLDPLMQDTFLNIIREEAGRGATVFMSSHILSEVAHACSRVLFMKKGRVVTDQATAEIEKDAGKLIHLYGDASQLKLLKTTAPDDARIINQENGKLSFRYDGDIHAALRWLSSKKFRDVDIENRQLDDIFKNMYADESEEQTS